MNHSKFQVLSIGHTHRSKFWSVFTDQNFVPDPSDLDPPGLDDQNQFMMTFYPLYGFLDLKKLKQSECQTLSIGPTHRSKLWSGLSTSNGLLAMAKLFASSACFVSFLKRRNISQSNHLRSIFETF